MLWNQLKGAKLGGHKFRRQHVIDHAIVDFFCPAKGLIVEVDGDTHDAAKDAIRDQRHAAKGFSTIRFTNADVGKNLDGVLTALSVRLANLPDRWPNSVPHPAASRHPSPEGEGR
jgi:very-short-patch-repair endonuclease